MAILKLKNATAGIYGFNYRSPVSGKMVTKMIDPMSTVEIFNGSVDDCSIIRLQATNILDCDDARLDECPIQFLWEGIMPTAEDYRGSLIAGEEQSIASANSELLDTVKSNAEEMTIESDLTVQKAGTRAKVTAKGNQE